MMDALSFLEDEKLQSFFRENKTEISVMENPQIFLKTLKDRDLIPEDKPKEVKQITTKEHREEAIYDILEYIEKSNKIRTFWTCVASEVILKRYPTLKKLYDQLTDKTVMQTKVEAPKKDKNKPNKKCPDEGQPGPSTQQTPGQKKNGKEKGSPNPINGKKVLPVMCGNKKGKLIRRKLVEGEKCIKVGDNWYNPIEFEEYGGRGSSKNWKSSIKHDGITLGKLIKDGHLKAKRYTKRKTTVRN